MPQETAAPAFTTCLPQEQFIMLRDHEIEERYRYRGFELSFLPIDPAISQLMSVLGFECEQRLNRLFDTAERIQVVPDLRVNLGNGAIPADMRRSHFFVVNQYMACQALSHALAAAEHSRQLHAMVLKDCSTLELNELLKEFIEQKRNACAILREVQESAVQVAG